MSRDASDLPIHKVPGAESKLAKVDLGVLIESAPNAMVILGDDGRILLANAYAEQLFGYGPGELLQEPFDVLARDLLTSRQEKETVNCARAVIAQHKDGSQIPVEIRLHVHEFNDCKWILVSFIDIGERQKAERESREAKNKLRLLLESTAEGIFGIDLEGRCTFCNPAAVRILGYEAADHLLGRNMHELIHHTRLDGTPHRAEDCPTLKAVQSGQEIHFDDEVLWRANGSSFHAEYWCRPQREGGKVVGAVAAFIDLTHHQQTTRALQKSEEKFAKAFRESPVLLALISVADHRYLDVNQTFERHTGYTRDEIIGRTPFDLGMWIDAAEHTAVVERVRREGRIRDIERHYRTRDGKPLVGLFTAELIEIADEQVMLSTIVDVTDRKRAVEELERSEERFRTTFRDAPGGMAMASPTGRFLVVNRAFCDFLGYTEQELLSSDIVSILHPDDRPSTVQRLRTLEDPPDSERIEKRYIQKNGEMRWGDLTRSLIRDAEGKPAYLICQVVDITERKRMEAELRQREWELKEAQRVAGVGSWQDSETGTFTWSDELYRIHGLDPGQLAPSFSELERFFTAGSWERLKAARQEAWETGHFPSVDLELIRPDGSKGWVAARGEAKRDAGGRIILRGTAQDITERKLAEQVLRETEARFRAVANSAPVMIWMSGPDKLCTYFNQPWLDFTGRPLEAELGNGWAENVHPDDLSSCMETYVRSFDQREPFQLEYRLRRYDGEYRWFLDRGVPRLDADGSFAGYIGSCADITDRRAGEEALRTVSGKLIEAQEKERSRIARELHDNISQRLALLSIGLQQLQAMAPDSTAQLRAPVEELLKQTAEVSSEVQVLSHGLHSANLEYLGLAPAIGVFCADLVRNQKVEIDFVHSSLPGSISPEIAIGLFRIAQEALHNAIKHSRVRRFEVQLLGKPGEVELAVRDCGVGFVVEAAKHGGLGLISMRERVHLLKGTLSIASQPMHGTQITVRVPVEMPLAARTGIEGSA